MSNFANIKSGIKTILEADADLGSGSVFDYEPKIGDITVDPFAIVTASDNENDFGNTAENRRTFGFVVRIFVERNSRGESAAETLLTSIVDRLINSFDGDITLSVSGVLFAKAAPSAWGYVLSDKEYRSAEIRIRALVWYDTT